MTKIYHICFTVVLRKMATLKISVLKHQARQDGTFPVSIRVTHERKTSYVATGVYVTKQQLTKNYEVKDPDVMLYISEKMKKYRQMLLDSNLDGVDAKGIAKYLSMEKSEASDIDFFEYGRRVADGKGQSKRNYQIMLRSLSNFLGKDKLPFSRISYKLLSDYESHLGEGRAASLYLSMMRHIYRQAMVEYNSGVNAIIKYDPFLSYRVPRQQPAEKRSLTVNQIISISNYTPTGILDTLAKDAFMMSFYLLGINSADLYHCPPIKDGRLSYCRRKTSGRRADKAFISVRIEPETQSFVDKYIDDNSEFAFRFHTMYGSEQWFNRAINDGLKIIGRAIGIERLTYYAARHSWATIARNDCRIAKSDIHEALNHVDEDMRITDTYIRKDWSVIDEANRKVIDYVNSAIVC